MEAPVVVTHVPVRSTHTNPSPLPPTALRHQASMVHPIPAVDGNLDSGAAALVWDGPLARIACAPSQRATPHALNIPEDGAGDVATGSGQTRLRTRRAPAAPSAAADDAVPSLAAGRGTRGKAKKGNGTAKGKVRAGG
jgi:hypothetical protein